MSRKHKTPRNRGPKGKATPKNTRGSMKRDTLEHINRIRKFKAQGAKQLLDEILQSGAGEQDVRDALEHLAREGKVVILESRKEATT